MAPTVFIVPGIWEGKVAFEPLVDALRDLGCSKVHVTTLPSTGTDSLSAEVVTMDDDVAAIASDLATVVDEAGEDGVIALMHSAGGFLGSNAMKGLTKAGRNGDGRAGGVTKIIFMAAAVAPEGHEHQPQPFMEINVSQPVAASRINRSFV